MHCYLQTESLTSARGAALAVAYPDRRQMLWTCVQPQTDWRMQDCAPRARGIDFKSQISKLASRFLLINAAGPAAELLVMEPGHSYHSFLRGRGQSSCALQALKSAFQEHFMSHLCCNYLLLQQWTTMVKEVWSHNAGTLVGFPHNILQEKPYANGNEEEDHHPATIMPGIPIG